MTYLNWIQTKEQYGARWLKVFYHNSSNKVFFLNQKEAKFSVTLQKFSILKYIWKVQRYDPSKYEFLLEYPGNAGVNRWTQTVHPFYGRSNVYNGYEPINITWSGANFTGLVKEGSSTFLKGSIPVKWHYAIGSYKNHGNEDTFPGPYLENEKGEFIGQIFAKEVYLWIRLRNSGNPFMSCSFKGKSHYSISLICYVFIVVASA